MVLRKLNHQIQTMIQKWDIVARVHFYSSAEGGRRTPITRDELRCIMTIDELNLDVRVYFQTVGAVSPGQTVTAPIRFLDPSTALPHCTVGKEFVLRELRAIAEGTMVDISAHTTS